MGATSSSGTATAATTSTSSGEGTSSSGDMGCDGDDTCPLGDVCVDGLCEPVACEPYTRLKDYEEPAVMLLIDKSRSMVLNTWDHDGLAETPEETRWKTLHRTIIAIGEGSEQSFDFGLKLFPDAGVPNVYGPAACAVRQDPDIVLAQGASGLLATTLPSAEATPMDGVIAGGTPATQAILVGVSHLKGLAASERSRFILMVTDGSANCQVDAADDAERFESYDMGVIDAAKEAVASGVEVAVVGLEISNIANTTEADGKPDSVVPTMKLRDLAEAGGLPPIDGQDFVNAVGEDSLADGLRALLQVMSCTITVTPPKGGAQLTALSIGGEKFGSFPVKECLEADGFADLGGGRLRLCGGACSFYLGALSVELHYECVGE